MQAIPFPKKANLSLWFGFAPSKWLLKKYDQDFLSFLLLSKGRYIQNLEENLNQSCEDVVQPIDSRRKEQNRFPPLLEKYFALCPLSQILNNRRAGISWGPKLITPAWLRT